MLGNTFPFRLGHVVAFAVGLIWCQSSHGAEPLGTESAEFFERKIRPVLIEHCYQCHAVDSDVIQGGLRLDDPQAMLQGGDSGAVVSPGDPDKSLLLAALRYDGLEMPPEGRLDDQIVKDFENWIRSGAVDPRPPAAEHVVSALHTDPNIEWAKAKKAWAFQSPHNASPPITADRQWGGGVIDQFVLAGLEEAGIAPNLPADRTEFIRRVTYDLTGLPPTPDAVEAYLQDDRPGSKQRLIDRLLASADHAQRWTRLWLDVARFAEDQAHKVGDDDALIYPNAYRYRDWVIEAMAADLPYDDFVRLQLAADLIDPTNTESHLALGFLGLGPKYYNRGNPEVMADEWEDRIDTVTRGLLGLTVACARCHDHKYDPVAMSDYYALAGVFASTEMFNRPLNHSVETKNEQAKEPKNAVHIVRDGKVQDVNLMIRGDVKNLGPTVKRRFLQILSDPAVTFEGTSGRENLADAIVDRDNPLTARVIVNRVWHQFFGRPLVATPSNFGALGSPPSHPELLDRLAVEFMDQGWSLKWLQRQIATSEAYAQSSFLDPAKESIDPENLLIWRVPPRRLGIEAYRDTLLFVTGRLDQQVGGKSIQPDDPESRRRTLYAEVSRMELNALLARFDFPDPNAHSAMRFETITPLQKLFLLNSPFVIRQADALAEQLEQHGGAHQSKIEYAYQLLWSRRPSSEELQFAEDFLSEDSQDVWVQYAQALLISNEMFIVD